MPREHQASIELPLPPERVFEILVTPEAIRNWWGAARAIVMPETDGLWMAAWGASENQPDYISVARLSEFSPPRRLVMSDFRYYARNEGPLPFDSRHLEAEFSIEARPGGSLLHLRQTGFPDEPVADDFYAGCETGWHDTLNGLKRYCETLAASLRA